MGNLHDFDPECDLVPVEEMLDIDRWILARTETLIRQCRASYDAFEFHKAYRAIYDFAATDLSSLYFDVLKDRLYTGATRGRPRQSGQTALYKVHYALVRLMAPFLSFTAEEAWSFTASPAGRAGQRLLWLFAGAGGGRAWARRREAGGLGCVDGGSRAGAEGAGRSSPIQVDRDVAGGAGAGGFSPTCCSVTLTICPRCSSFLKWLWMPKAGSWSNAPTGLKCERCWKYSTGVGEDAEYPDRCGDCAPVLKDMLQ